MNGRRQSLTASAREERRIAVERLVTTFPAQVEAARLERERDAEALRAWCAS